MADESGVAGIRPPKPLTFTENMSANWKDWVQQFNWYATASQLSKKSAEVQAATFMAVIGPEAIQIFNNFNLTEAEQKDIEQIKNKFQEYFIPKINVSFERYNFFKIVQKEDEPFEEFLKTIKTQAKTCEFNNLTDSLLKDKIVFGVQSDAVREKLLTEENLDLNKAISMCRASEQATKQLKEMNISENSNVNLVKGKKKDSSKEMFMCTRCGTRHKKQSCPAFQNKCDTCNKKGHFASQCWSKKENKAKKVTKIHSVEDSENQSDRSEDEQEILYIRRLIQNEEQDWHEIIQIGKKKIKVKLDTGAQCNVLPKWISDKLECKIRQSNTKRLVSFTDDKITVLGEATLNCNLKGMQQHITFKIVEKDVPPILGRKSCENLGLVVRVQQLKYTNKDENIFKGLGCLKNYEYDIDLVENPQFRIQPTRRIPYYIKKQVREELDKMVKLGVIKPMKEPTPVVSPMVVVKQKDKLRICIDPTDVNKNILRRHYPLKTIEEMSAEINGSKYFTLLDCKRGFWQIKVTDRTQKFLTFSTPWGRYCCTRLPFGISAAPEVFQEAINFVLGDSPNVQCYMDDILIFADSMEKIKNLTEQVIEKLKEAGLKLNYEKCIFAEKSVKFMGHIFTANGISLDPSKVEAIQNMNTPKNVTELQRLLGMITYLNKFIPNMSELTEPLRKLLQKNVVYQWNFEQEEAFQRIKKILTTPPVLRYYDVNKDITLSVDASSKSLGAVILQENQPIAYATKALTASQQNWPQIEKEAFAIKFGCHKFHDYVFGKNLTIETDHKPLETIFKKPIQCAPARLQRILLDVSVYSPKIIYKKGKEIPIADLLSRDIKTDNNHEETEEEELVVQIILAISESARKSLVKATEEDKELQTLINYIKNGFPNDRLGLPEIVRHYHNFREELSTYEGLVFKGEKVIVPKSEIKEMLKQIHAGHLGIQSCLKRARQLLYWKGQYDDIVNFVKKCVICESTQRSNPKEPIILKEIPNRPWERVATDLFTYKEQCYISIIDSYSGYIDFKKLKTTTSKEVIEIMKDWFSTHGIAEVVETDNGPQYSSRQFHEFAKEWGFKHQTSSPHHSQGNGLAERGVQIAKNILRKCSIDKSDVKLALLNYRNTPRNQILGTPSQRLFSRITRSTIPISIENLKPKIVENVQEELTELRLKQKKYGDQHRKTKEELKEGERIRYKIDHRSWRGGEVIQKNDNPRSIIIQTDNGKQLRRNSGIIHKTSAIIPEKKELVTLPKSQPEIPEDVGQKVIPETRSQSSAPDPPAPQSKLVTPENVYRTKSGRTVKPRVKLDL